MNLLFLSFSIESLLGDIGGFFDKALTICGVILILLLILFILWILSQLSGGGRG